MATVPHLETERLRLVPFTDDAHLTPRYVAWLNDSEVVRYSELRHSTHTLDLCRDYLHSFAGTPHYFWAITTRDASFDHIGNITAHVDEPNRVADIGILIGEKEAWGKGYGTEAWCAVCKWLLQTGGMRKVTAGTMALNHGMLAIMRHVGMEEESRRRQQFLLHGRPVDLVQCAAFRREVGDDES
jgi:ribosomal-protein-alanine N-acetyltransferase